MNNGQDLKTLLENLQEINRNQKDFVMQSKAIKFKGDGKIEIEKLGSFFPTEVAHEQFSDKTGIPRKYYHKMQQAAPQLLAENVNHWLEKDDSTRMIRTSGETCRAYLSNRFFAIDNIVVASLVIPKLIDAGAEIKSCQLTDRRLYIQAIFPDIFEEVKDDDIVQSGICISNSDVGCGSCKIEPLIYRLVCSNGMISKVALKKYHVGSLIENSSDIPTEVISDETRELKTRAISSEINDVIEYSFNEKFFKEEVGKLKNTTKRTIEASRIEPVIKDVSSRFNLMKFEAEETMNRLIESLDLSQWGLSNAITSLANDVNNYDRAIDLERIGGAVAFMGEHEWNGIIA